MTFTSSDCLLVPVLARMRARWLRAVTSLISSCAAIDFTSLQSSSFSVISVSRRVNP